MEFWQSFYTVVPCHFVCPSPWQYDHDIWLNIIAKRKCFFIVKLYTCDLDLQTFWDLIKVNDLFIPGKAESSLIADTTN